MIDALLSWLLSNRYWLVSQGLVQNYSGLVAFMGMLMMWHHSCDAHLWCWRPGKHAVAGTSWSTCSNHKTAAIHDRMFHLHDAKHQERL